MTEFASRYLLILHGLPIVGRLILLLLLRRSTLDERCFLLKVLTKFAAVPGISMDFMISRKKSPVGFGDSGPTQSNTWLKIDR